MVTLLEVRGFKSYCSTVRATRRVHSEGCLGFKMCVVKVIAFRNVIREEIHELFGRADKTHRG
jgi:hypothetical protein